VKGRAIVFVLVTGDGGDARATVEDQQNLKQLHVEFRGPGDGAADAALRAAGLGSLEGDHAWLEAAALRAAGDGSPGWNAQFDAMLSFAASRGWTSDDSSLVRAHIVRG
jgi:hypothetical protein